jgi:HSP20 family protein
MARHKWDPVRDLMTLQERMNSLFEETAQRRAQPGVPPGAEPDDEMEHADWYPVADVYELENEFVVALDLPGITHDALDVGINEDKLMIRGERQPLAEPQNPRRAERPQGRFLRKFTLPPVIDREAITADYKDGVLLLHLPKRTEQQSRRVKIDIR